MTRIEVNLGERSYPITVGRGLLCRAGELINLDRRVLVVTDDGVPCEYARAVAATAKEARIVTVGQGEESKSITVLERLLREMADMGLTRSDCAVAVGGGVVGDLTGFAAACYMRGIDFYNAPTTLLSQVDSSIGGKTAVNLGGIKNIVGAFHQPKGVLIDTDTLKTLPKRQISSGLCEAVKMALTSDAELFCRLEQMSLDKIIEEIDDVIPMALKIKKDIVERDEREGSVRKILNFGHTFGHGVEAECRMQGLYHGECVAIGMIPMCAPSVRERLVPMLSRLGLPTHFDGNLDRALEFVCHDKKAARGGIDCVLCHEVGSAEIRRLSMAEIENTVKSVF